MHYVSYFRVSTDRQGRSGLGLDAQRGAVSRFIRNGDRIVATFTKVESGRCKERPQLAAALAECRRMGATLLIAKLDRLARNVHFISGLMEARVPFLATDMPEANKLTIHMLAAVAEHEAEMISARTKAALAAAKQRGVTLGGYRGGPALTADAREAGRLASLQSRRAKASRNAASIMPVLAELREAGVVSASSIARHLNDRGLKAPRGGPWRATQVRRIFTSSGN